MVIWSKNGLSKHPSRAVLKKVPCEEEVPFSHLSCATESWWRTEAQLTWNINRSHLCLQPLWHPAHPPWEQRWKQWLLAFIEHSCACAFFIPWSSGGNSWCCLSPPWLTAGLWTWLIPAEPQFPHLQSRREQSFKSQLLLSGFCEIM